MDGVFGMHQSRKGFPWLTKRSRLRARHVQNEKILIMNGNIIEISQISKFTKEIYASLSGFLSNFV